jgi:alginate O-acetyltransferase complex protein AlgI
MLFNSYVFMLLFLPAMLACWWGLRRHNSLRLTLLVAASYLFYGWKDWEFTFLLLASTLIDFVVGQRLHGESRLAYRRGWLAVSLFTNLGMLGYFKYRGLFAEAVNGLLLALRTGSAIDVPEVYLPIGISFYTFQTLSYTLDIYRGQVKPTKSLLHFAAYVCMFPQLIAGPIVRYRDIETQLDNLIPTVPWESMSRGIWFFVIGMAQKLLVADVVATGINPLLVEPQSLQFISGWYTLLGYSLQLYFDFAGYSNMAIGLGLMLGFQFPQNFDSPYKAHNIQDFWRRWHQTLSSFLRDYLYIPLGGNRRGHWISIRNLIVVMVLGGLWHGADWTFLLWGTFHGLLLMGHATLKQLRMPPLPQVASVAITFFCVVMGWMIFRSDSLAMLNCWCLAICGRNGIEQSLGHAGVSPASLAIILAGMIACWALPNAWQIEKRINIASAVILAVLMTLCILRFDAESPFLYFQF